ncbi:MAG: hypothetical protein ABH842_00905 [Candidatus Micrarchaeota archaeon]
MPITRLSDFKVRHGLSLTPYEKAHTPLLDRCKVRSEGPIYRDSPVALNVEGIEKCHTGWMINWGIGFGFHVFHDGQRTKRKASALEIHEFKMEISRAAKSNPKIKKFLDENPELKSN